MKFSPTSLAAVAVLASTASVASAQLTDFVFKFAGEDLSIPLSTQKSYNGGQDQYLKRPLILADGGRNVTLEGNMHRALPFPEKISVTKNTILDFDFYLGDEEEVHAICVDYDLNQNGRQCFVLGGTQQVDWPQVDPDITNSPGTLQEVGETRHYTIKLGEYFTGSARYKWLVFMQDNDSSNRDTGHSSFANVEISGYEDPLLISLQPASALGTAATASDISLVMSKEVSGKPSQDKFANPLTVADAGRSISMQSNVWRAVPFSEPLTVGVNDNLEFDFTLREKTEHHALCLLEEPGEYDWAPYCFVVSNTQNWDSAPYNMIPKANEGDINIHYSIPMGYVFANRTFNYMGFLQDNDAGDRLYGNMTFSNITIKDMGSRPKLKITVGDAEVLLDSTEVISAGPWGSSQDTVGHFLEFPDDVSVTLRGNTHKAFKLPQPINVTAATEIAFDFSLGSDPEENHVVCLLKEDKTTLGGDKGCVQIAGYNGSRFSKTFTKNGNSYKFALGRSANIGADVKQAHYISVMQDNDKSGNRDTGLSTFSSISVYDRPSISVDVYGNETLLLNHQQSYGNRQDSTGRLLTVSKDGKTVTMAGNNWKAFKFPSPVSITDDTVLSLNVKVDEEADFTSICFDEDRVEGRGARCIKLGGTQKDGLGKIIYKGIKQTYEGEPEAQYLIKLSELFTGDMNYIAFLLDNDSADRSTGISHISNVQLYNKQTSCLDSAPDFTLTFDKRNECTVDNFLDGIIASVPDCSGVNTTEGAMEELLAYFDAKSDSEVSDRIQTICASANAPNMVDFAAIMESENQFIEEVFDGGTTWNYLNTSPKNIERIQTVANNFENSMGIRFPDVHNFHGCKLRTAMCCFVDKRGAGTDLDLISDDNSDACYVDFSKSRQSSHVRDGYSIYGDSSEGALNCHGFAWGNDDGYGDAAFKGNTLFEIALKKGIFDNQYVEELPGAPMCGCIEQMPVVTNSACTKTVVDQQVTVNYDSIGDSFLATSQVTSISHEDCKDLSTYYASLVTEGKATQKEKDELDEHIVSGDSCVPAITNFLGTKGFVFDQTATVQTVTAPPAK